MQIYNNMDQLISDGKWRQFDSFNVKPISFDTNFTINYSIDLKAFERRLMEIVTLQRPATRRWRIVLIVSSLMTSFSAYYWLNDPKTAYISLLDSLMGHYMFTINCIILIALFAMGIHKRVVATSMYAIPYHFIQFLTFVSIFYSIFE